MSRLLLLRLLLILPHLIDVIIHSNLRLLTILVLLLLWIADQHHVMLRLDRAVQPVVVLLPPRLRRPRLHEHLAIRAL